MASRFGFTIPAESPFCIARRKKEELMFSRIGSPKDTLETPRTVFPPSSSRTLLTVSRVVSAPFLSELTAMQRQSTRISFFGIP